MTLNHSHDLVNTLTHLVLHIWRPLHVFMWALHVSLRPMHPSCVAHSIVVWHVAMCPGWGPHHSTLHGTLRAHQVPLRWHHAPLWWRFLWLPRTHSSQRGALHPPGPQTMRALGAHVPGRSRVSLHTLHVWWTYHTLTRPLVRLGPRRWAHLTGRYESRLHTPRAHGVTHLLRRHVWRKSLLIRRHWTPRAREGGHWALSLQGAHIPIRVQLVHPVNFHLLQQQRHTLFRKYNGGTRPHPTPLQMLSSVKRGEGGISV